MAHYPLRKAEWYRDARGWSEVAEQLRWLTRSNPRAARAILNKIDTIRQVSFEEALRGPLLKKASPTIYVLRVQSGSIAYRLPFFEPLCRGGELIVFTHCGKRDELDRAAYTALIESAEERRRDWIERNCGREDENGRDDGRR